VLKEMAFVEARGIKPDILMDRDGAVSAITITNQAEVDSVSGICCCS
jgi:hypothetical protein